MNSEIDVTSLVVVGADITAKRIESIVGAPTVCTSTGERSFFRIVLPESEDPSTSTGELIDWCGLLFEKALELKQLSDIGCEMYLECALMTHNVYIDVEVMHKLAKMDIGISVWFKFPAHDGVPEQYDHQLVIPEPILWYSLADETAFYKGLAIIDAIKGFEIRSGRPLDGQCNHLVLFLEQPIMHEYSLRNLIGLMHRYSLDLSSLAAQCTKVNAHWFKDPINYWYQAVFGDPTTKEA